MGCVSSNKKQQQAEEFHNQQYQQMVSKVLDTQKEIQQATMLKLTDQMKASLITLNQELQADFQKQFDTQQQKNQRLTETLYTLNELLKQRQIQIQDQKQVIDGVVQIINKASKDQLVLQEVINELREKLQENHQNQNQNMQQIIQSNYEEGQLVELRMQQQIAEQKAQNERKLYQNNEGEEQQEEEREGQQYDYHNYDENNYEEHDDGNNQTEQLQNSIINTQNEETVMLKQQQMEQKISNLKSQGFFDVKLDEIQHKQPEVDNDAILEFLELTKKPDKTKNLNVDDQQQGNDENDLLAEEDNKKWWKNKKNT